MWTPELEATGRRLYAQGLSAALIAAELGNGITRNAVVGQSYRGGWKRDADAVKQELPRGKQPAQPAIAAPPTEPAPQPAPAPRPVIAAKSAPVQRPPLPRPALVVAAPPPRPPAPSVADPDDKPLFGCDGITDIEIEDASNGVAFIDIGPDACRWPLTETRPIDDFRFCGRAAAHGPYCERHAAKAYTAARAKPQISESERQRRRQQGRNLVASGKFF